MACQRRLRINLPALPICLSVANDEKKLRHCHSASRVDARSVVSPGSMPGPSAPCVGTARMHTHAISEMIKHRDHGSEKLASPANVLDYVFLGDSDAAMNVPLLRFLGIDSIVNCASGSVLTSNEFYDEDFAYVEFEAEDMPGYDLLGNHFEDTRQFLDDCRLHHRKALVHCAAGINRSAALVVAYYMVSQNQKLADAVRFVFNRRPIILCNEGFIEQLVRFAYLHDLL
jgi:hypothetical protein